MDDTERQRMAREARAQIVTAPPARSQNVLRYLAAQGYAMEQVTDKPGVPAARRVVTTPRVARASTGPERHRPARRALMALALVVGGSAVYGGVGLMVDGLGLPVAWLDRTPFDSWLLPGVLLLVLVALPMIAAAFAELARWRWAYAAGLAAGALQIGWIAGQWIVLQRYFVLQPVLLGCGVLVAALAWWVHRR